MSARAHRASSPFERGALVVAALGLAAAAALAIVAPGDLAPAYRFAVFVVLQPALGSLLFLFIHRLTGGQWGDALRPFFVAGLSLLPWLWLLVAPLLWTWQTPAFATEAAGGVAEYLGRGAVALRFIVYGLIFAFFAVISRRRAHDEDPRWLAPTGLIVMVLTLHFAAVDWIFSREPGWYSTGFPLIWMTGHGVSALALAVCAVIGTGGDPDANGAARRPLGVDWGNLLITGIMLWSYVMFGQLIVIWMGNLPREVIWYVRRSQGGWAVVALALAVFHLFLPLVLLFWRRVKRSRRTLASIAALIAVAQLTYTAWLLLPGEPLTPASIGLGLALLALLGGLFLNRYLGGARRWQEQQA